eukprot:gnl/Spiro4/28483_TR14075_c0_g1_i1.p1 gnl/Spiro4/28483_TR14075_c0_g1~~gnl/Spiro4/28483_TR14075_c0_g1_i1.p1  ORF type:complete len:400 (-),score=88.55 gnl/Spiro4/28483_TR14075_c0_g1_i1:257-1456(-)
MHTPPEREFDIVIFGATGFTGQFVVRELISRAWDDPRHALKWAVAGRSSERLSDLLGRTKVWARNTFGTKCEELVSFVGVIVAACDDRNSMEAMCARTRLLINCVGPYRFYGEITVSSCILTRTDYIDITGEPQFIESMIMKYHDKAAQAGTLVVPSCGFDSVPADLGALFLQKAFAHLGLACSSIDSIVSIAAGPHGAKGHYTTWECAVHGFGDQQALKQIRMAAKWPPVKAFGPPQQIRNRPFRDPRVGHLWCYMFPGSDASVVRLSQQTLSRLQPSFQPCSYSAYFSLSTFLYLPVLFVVGGVMRFLSRWRWGRWLLLTFPRFFSYNFFSHDGPTEQQMNETSFKMKLFGKGYQRSATTFSDENATLINAVVSGPEPGYVATPIIAHTCSRETSFQ